MFSPYVRFRGGKGVATAAGMFLALAPLAVLISLAIWAITLWLSGYVSVASITVAVLFPLWVRLTAPEQPYTFWAGVVMALLIIYSHRDKIGRGALVVSVSKGLDPERLSTPSCVLADVLPKDAPIAVLSGPSFAREVYARQPTAVVAAAREHATAQRVQQVFSTGFFRVYSATDVLGVELAGALKNVIALAAGILEGLGMGHNTRAALITRGLAEITRLGVALGAEPAT